MSEPLDYDDVPWAMICPNCHEPSTAVAKGCGANKEDICITCFMEIIKIGVQIQELEEA